MFNDIGFKIKCIAKVFCYVGIVLSVLLGIFYIFAAIEDYEPYLAVLGIMLMILGPLLSWMYSCFAYGFGQLIENTSKKEIEEDTEEDPEEE